MADYEHDDFFGDLPPAATDPVPQQADSVAATTPETESVAAAPGNEVEVEAASTESAAVAVPTSDPATSLGGDVVGWLTRERLPFVQGETREQALLRLNSHYDGMRRRVYHEELKPAREAAERTQSELLAFKQSMEPILRSWYEQQQLAVREAQLAQMPEEGTPEYLVWQNNLILNHLQQRAVLEQQYAEQARVQAEEDAVLGEVLSVDESAVNELVTAIQSDPDAKQAYEFAVRFSHLGAARRFPTATPQQIEQLVSLSHQLEMRHAKRAGMSVADFYKQQRADALSLLTPAQQAAVAATASNGNGAANGHVEAPATPALGSAGLPARPAPVSQVAANIARSNANAAARAVVSATPAATSTPPPGSSVDFASMSEDDFLEYSLSSPQAAAEIANWMQQKHGKSSWR